MKKLIALSMVLVAFLLEGCIPAYQLPKNCVNIVRVNTKQLSSPLIFANNRFYRLPVDNAGHGQLPVGKRIIVGSNYHESRNKGVILETLSCFPVLSFVPFVDYEYYLDFNIIKKRCYLSVLRRPVGTNEAYHIDPTIAIPDKKMKAP